MVRTLLLGAYCMASGTVELTRILSGSLPIQDAFQEAQEQRFTVADKILVRWRIQQQPPTLP